MDVLLNDLDFRQIFQSFEFLFNKSRFQRNSLQMIKSAFLLQNILHSILLMFSKLVSLLNFFRRLFDKHVFELKVLLLLFDDFFREYEFISLRLNNTIQIRALTSNRFEIPKDLSLSLKKVSNFGSLTSYLVHNLLNGFQYRAANQLQLVSKVILAFFDDILQFLNLKNLVIED